MSAVRSASIQGKCFLLSGRCDHRGLRGYRRNAYPLSITPHHKVAPGQSLLVITAPSWRLNRTAQPHGATPGFESTCPALQAGPALSKNLTPDDADWFHSGQVVRCRQSLSASHMWRHSVHGLICKLPSAIICGRPTKMLAPSSMRIAKVPPESLRAVLCLGSMGRRLRSIDQRGPTPHKLQNNA